MKLKSILPITLALAGLALASGTTLASPGDTHDDLHHDLEDAHDEAHQDADESHWQFHDQQRHQKRVYDAYCGWDIWCRMDNRMQTRRQHRRYHRAERRNHRRAHRQLYNYHYDAHYDVQRRYWRNDYRRR